jgi:hypothetical protein
MQNYQGYYEGYQECEIIRRPNPDEEPVVNPFFISDDDSAKREAIGCAREMEAKVVAGVWKWWTDRF